MVTKTITFLFLCSVSFGFSQNTDIGHSFITELLVNKNSKNAYSFFDTTVKAKISEFELKETIEKLDVQLGRFKNIIEINNTKEVYYYYSAFEKMSLDIKLAFNENNKIIGFFFVPHKEFEKKNYIGKDHNIKSKDIYLQGTLLIPEKDNKKRLVIFVHGSGPNDRDETIYENKPFKNIAEGLYSKGIASYRFDKRTFSNPESLGDKSTIDDEVTNDVLNTIAYFNNSSEYADYKIIVIGHSLGANLLPKIANLSTNISKIILLAGSPQPLDKILIEQYKYLYKLSPTPELKTILQNTEKQVALLNSKSFNMTTPKEQLPLGLSPYYWKSLLDYNPIIEIKKVKIPILILQGERDYQVTSNDFKLWKRKLKKNKAVKFVSYPKLNHIFFSGEKISEPSEYMIKGNVNEQVISDIIDFIIKD